ncbi:hypothetical protein SAMN03159343_3187 [Klenkia marina]|uniref:Uncharacterized protein n=1 Tax=Klenkia marina TaxID=1960309 RepID=A0A1G4YND8_9ACTN|nr:hypothetical protein [Klenkia marina]SCX55016.1 hypothetical protein SAMN03159343_3187 [Klenkia marina]
MGWAIGAVLVLLVGLPVVAVWWSRRAIWSRSRPGHERDPFGDTMRRHGLGPAAMARVENAVLWGKRLDDPAERAAVVELAAEAAPRPTSRSRQWQVVSGLLWVAAAVGVLVFVVLTERWDSAYVWGLVWLIPTGWAVVGPRRALRRNSD